MKKKWKIILISIILFIFLILILGKYILNRYETYTLTIYKIIDSQTISAYYQGMVWYTLKQDAQIYDKDNNLLNISDLKIGDTIFAYIEIKQAMQEAVVKRIHENNTVTVETLDRNVYYSMSIKNTKIVDCNDKKIDASQLAEGQTIYVINKIPKIRNSLGGILEDVKLIKVLNEN